eukprot:scaffold163160_cov20-Tisochrysis_lutea.AAC.1
MQALHTAVKNLSSDTLNSIAWRLYPILTHIAGCALSCCQTLPLPNNSAWHPHPCRFLGQRGVACFPPHHVRAHTKGCEDGTTSTLGHGGFERK